MVQDTPACCDACSSVSSGRRLTLMSTQVAAPECCRLCPRLARTATPGAAQAAQAVRKEAAAPMRIVPAPRIEQASRVSLAARQVAVASAAASAAESATNFDVVLIKSKNARALFQEKVRTFKHPDEDRRKWPASAYANWQAFKESMESDVAISSYVQPVIAMNGETPCAAAIYTNADMNKEDTFQLENLVGNAGEECRGAGAALMCYMIRKSTDSYGDPKPMRVLVSESEPFLGTFAKSFGCAEPKSLFGGLFGGSSSFTTLTCEDQNPPQCQAFANKVFKGEDYFDVAPDTVKLKATPRPIPNALASSHLFSIDAAALLGFFAGGVMSTFVVLRFGRGMSAMVTEPLLLA
eukprot:gnl/TRDRNA2_/TRDRNA2_200495_c0_seq1.p1 gnl/TRDRNA2_/TRDRNA2_200495_c0~~gnl/TRDRNA2_/TRDRNA2_200495_c0_seq1.p1  ORF type:complete len:391 (+),score=49.27 gnl/TRDRNA2_/TRDRNA2_200495_c0_seq1:119-1174(+)